MTELELRDYAKQLIADERFKALLKRLKDDAIAQWEAAPDPLKRDSQWHRVQAINSLATTVRQLHDEGKHKLPTRT